jgi:hypothetical protein
VLGNVDPDVAIKARWQNSRFREHQNVNELTGRRSYTGSERIRKRTTAYDKSNKCGRYVCECVCVYVPTSTCHANSTLWRKRERTAAHANAQHHGMHPKMDASVSALPPKPFQVTTRSFKQSHW